MTHIISVNNKPNLLVGLLRIGLLTALCLGSSLHAYAQDKQDNSADMVPVKLFAAGSLKVALGEIAQAWSEQTGIAVETQFAPSGLLRERIEAGEHADLFASANMRHPQTLQSAGKSTSVVLFVRNQLCALTAAGLSVDSDGLLDAMLDESNRVATSTPRADPSGDYAYTLFAKTDAQQPGAQQTLEGKSLQLTGGPNSKQPPEGRNNYAWVMDSDQAEIFLTYCTNAVLAQQEVPALGIVQVPEAFAVGADYGLTVMNDAHSNAAQLALHILSPDAQSILASYGFSPVTLPR
ncbi:molybdate ABC transporter substrate-binding protein [Granulosicoccus antarcticus]|uniref:Molybdate-binding periplasmic protein n=1 Tax=Granulosicoccus antarcticus IMCC3135 TaxID=1192854 RepID=A0A2Z2NV13_9GAMM|nr:molybdate ABC transporter substrate-binding protein [Granulosicoccus antarcticus]ASJ70954.1 Molybdate-binding periplasmic protein [Granulosicoccus antarcticus IMCC3135]